MNDLILPETLPIARYRLTFLLNQSFRLPEYAGSTLRGALGHALREAVCVCGQTNQHDHDCPYLDIFNAPPQTQLNVSQRSTPPQAYVIEPPFPQPQQFQAGEVYAFDMVLCGQIQQLLPLIISAWKLVFQRGIGKEKGTGILQNVAVQMGDNWQILTEHQWVNIHKTAFRLPENPSHNYVMTLHTPLRIQHNGKLCRAHNLTADIVLRQVMRRVSSITQLYCHAPMQANFNELIQMIDSIEFESNLIWYDNTRYSNRQQQRVPLGGVLGSIQLRHVPPQWAMLLHIGQWLHIGKETVFGLGKYSLTAA